MEPGHVHQAKHHGLFELGLGCLLSKLYEVEGVQNGTRFQCVLRSAAKASLESALMSIVVRP
jgi:hypothetical protein